MKAARLDIRTTSNAKSTIETAAQFLGTTLSAFVLESAMQRAVSVLKDAQTINLSNSEHDRLLKIIENSSEPNANLKRLFDQSDKN